MSGPENEVRPSDSRAGSQAGLNGPSGSPPSGLDRDDSKCASGSDAPTGEWVDLLTTYTVPQATINSAGTRYSWEMGRFERAWWHLRCGRPRLAMRVLRRG